LRGRYEQGETVAYDDEAWVFDDAAARPALPPSREYRQLLSTILNGLVDQGYRLVRVEEERYRSAVEPVPGSWDHLVATMPPWLFFWARLDARG
jgi:hypothetical protein